MLTSVLHPRYKSTYFLKAGWPCEWVQAAEDLLRNEWERNYKPKSASMSIIMVGSTVLACEGNIVTYSQPPPSKNKYFDDFDSFNSASSSADPIMDWLTSPPIPGADGLMWWTAMESSRHPLYPMGMNFLSTPGMLVLFANISACGCFWLVATSTDVERAFSKGGLTVSKMRHSLYRDESTQAACVLDS